MLVVTESLYLPGMPSSSRSEFKLHICRTYHLTGPPLPHVQIRGSKDLVGFLFNDFFLLVKPKVFFHRAATPADLDPFGKNEFQMYRKVGTW